MKKMNDTRNMIIAIIVIVLIIIIIALKFNSSKNEKSNKAYEFNSNWNYDKYPDGDSDKIKEAPDERKIGDQIELIKNNDTYGELKIDSVEKKEDYIEITYTYKNVNYDGNLLIDLTDFTILDKDGNEIKDVIYDGDPAQSLQEGESLTVKITVETIDNNINIKFNDASFANSKRSIEFRDIKL